MVIEGEVEVEYKINGDGYRRLNILDGLLFLEKFRN